MLWSFFKIGKMDKRLDLHAIQAELRIKKLEKRLMKEMHKANNAGAEIVKAQFDKLLEGTRK